MKKSKGLWKQPSHNRRSKKGKRFSVNPWNVRGNTLPSLMEEIEVVDESTGKKQKVLKPIKIEPEIPKTLTQPIEIMPVGGGGLVIEKPIKEDPYPTPYVSMLRLAKRFDTPQEILDKLANAKEWQIRLAVAENNKTSPKTLDKLSRDNREEVRLAVIENNKTSSKTLHNMIHNPINNKAFILDSLARNEKTKLEDLYSLYAKGIMSAKRSALKNYGREI